MTENQNTNQELSFTYKQLTDGVQKFINTQGNAIYCYKGLTQQEIVCLVLTEFLAFTNKEQEKKSQLYQEYLKLKAEFEGTETAPVVKDQPKDTPWYPDDSGEWVEVEMGKGKPLGLKDDDIVQVLKSYERRSKRYCDVSGCTGNWSFGDAVAYKKVK